MQKLIFTYYWNIPWEASGTEVFTIECSSKLKLQIYVLDKVKEARKETSYINLFNFDFYNLDELERQIEHNLFTLEEWYEKNKIQIK
jgi:hypothetical protein